VIAVFGDDLEDDYVRPPGVIPVVFLEVVTSDFLGDELDLVGSGLMIFVFIRNCGKGEVPVTGGVVVVEDDLLVSIEPSHFLPIGCDRPELRHALSEVFDRRDEPKEHEQFEQ
jgi:hypothetical protein